MLALSLGGAVRVIPDHPLPRRQSGEALIRMDLVGVCDTDLELARGYMGFSGVPGHEFVGTVVEADDPRWLTKRVVGDINAGCGDCPDCRNGDGHHCPDRTVLGISGRDGALAEYFTLPERCLREVPAALPDERAVFAEPLAAALRVLDALPNPEGCHALVLGDGKLGLLVTLVLLEARARVTLVGHHAEHLALVPDRVRTLHESELGPGAERAKLVVEATGGRRGLARALGLVEPRGTVVLKTTLARPHEVDLSRAVVDEIAVVGSRCGDIGAALRMLAAGAVDPSPLVAARYPLARADHALAHAARPGVLKVLVQGT
jgi:alcohol dehydrogenase